MTEVTSALSASDCVSTVEGEGLARARVRLGRLASLVGLGGELRSPACSVRGQPQLRLHPVTPRASVQSRGSRAGRHWPSTAVLL